LQQRINGGNPLDMLDTSAKIQALAESVSPVEAERSSSTDAPASPSTDMADPIPAVSNPDPVYTSISTSNPASAVTWSHWTETWRLMPTKAQHGRLQRALDVTRELYNAALEERFTKLARWHQTGKFRVDMQPVVDPITGKKRYPPNPYFPSAFSGYGDLTEIRAGGHELANYPVNLCRGVIDRADRAFKSFYARKSNGKAGGRPRFKPASRWRTLEFSALSGVRLMPAPKRDEAPGNDTAADGGGAVVANRGHRVRGATHLLVFKPVGALRVHAHRPVPDGAVLTGLRLVRKADGIWEAHLGFKVRKADGLDLSLLEPTFGADWNVGALAVGSDGSTLPNPRLGATARKARRPQERLVARSKRGSKARAKKVRRLAVLREREADARRTHLHTVSKRFVEAVVAKGHRAMAIEDTDVAGLMAKTISAFHLDGSRPSPHVSRKESDGFRNDTDGVHPWEIRSGQRALKRSLADASIGKLILYTTAKAERAGLGVVKVAAGGTTQTCARCGTKSSTKVTLQDRVFACACGWRCDRDVNAALNVLRRGRGKLDAKPSAKEPWATPAGHPALEVLALKARGVDTMQTGAAAAKGVRRTSAARQTGA
jgi:putative transposase